MLLSGWSNIETASTTPTIAGLFAQTPPSISRTWSSGLLNAGKYVGAAGGGHRDLPDGNAPVVAQPRVVRRLEKVDLVLAKVEGRDDQRHGAVAE